MYKWIFLYICADLSWIIEEFLLHVDRPHKVPSIHPVLKKDSNHAQIEMLAADPFSPEKK